MYTYRSESLKSLLENVIRNCVESTTLDWLKEKAKLSGPAFNAAFVMMPRKTGKQAVQLTEEQRNKIKAARPFLDIHNWPIDRVARIWLLLNLDTTDKQHYFSNISSLFAAAEMNELVALYAALPVLAWPELWVHRCSEGIRNNIGDVLQSIMCNNPYPSENLDEAAWNQLVLKAFFTEKPIEEIVGLDRRANKKLAETLSDYAHERWAAHRKVNPMLWRCVGPFLNDDLLKDIKTLLSSTDRLEIEAAALACNDSGYQPAKELIPSSLKNAIHSGTLSWGVLANKIKENVLQP